MPLKALIVISGTVIASAVTVLPAFAPGAIEGPMLARPIPNAAYAPLARKGDRLREYCTNAVWTAVCAGTVGLERPRQSRTIERRIGQSTSVLIRIPTS